MDYLFVLQITYPTTSLPRRTLIILSHLAPKQKTYHTLNSQAQSIQAILVKMFSPAIVASLLLGLSQIPNSFAQPVNASSFIITHVASSYFPNAKSDLSAFDVDVQFVGFNATTQSWLTGLDPASGSTDEEKAMLITAAAYAKPFDANDPDMTEDVNALLAAIDGKTTAVQKRDGSAFKTASAHAVAWSACGAFFSCLSGTTCTFSLDVGKAPRSQCQAQGSSACCISWSNYNVRAGFFSTTWTTCNAEVTAQGQSSASCEGYGSSAQGGDVCLSNRATGCT